MEALTGLDNQPVPLPVVSRVYQAKDGVTVASLKDGTWTYVKEPLTEACRLIHNERVTRTLTAFMAADDTDVLGPDGEPWPLGLREEVV